MMPSRKTRPRAVPVGLLLFPEHVWVWLGSKLHAGLTFAKTLSPPKNVDMVSETEAERKRREQTKKHSTGCGYVRGQCSGPHAKWDRVTGLRSILDSYSDRQRQSVKITCQWRMHSGMLHKLHSSPRCNFCRNQVEKTTLCEQM